MVSQQMNEDIVYEPRRNRFAEISLWCGIIGIGCAPWIPSPLLAITPIASTIGLITGIIALVLYYRPDSDYEGVKEAWIGFTLCAITFCVAGYLLAQLGNYVRGVTCRSNQREIAVALLLYAQDHNGYLPTSLRDIDDAIPAEKRFCRSYSFYYLHRTRPYVMNRHLAGKNIMVDLGDWWSPSRIILLAEGKNRDATSFSSLSEIDLKSHGHVTFLDGSTGTLSLDTVDKHFPPDGKVTEETWFITPPQGVKP
jgi:hypothetical protein